MKWIENHLNWTYGIALIIGLIAAIWAIFFSSVAGYIIYIVIIWVGGYLVAWRKDNWDVLKFPLVVLVPPLLAIIVLCSRNKRFEKVEKVESKKELL